MLNVIELSCFSEIGKKTDNEDAFYPVSCSNDDENKVYAVADGVGGYPFGEVAARLACDYFSSYINKKENVSYQDIMSAIIYTEEKFDKYIIENPECEGMATTLVGLVLNTNDILVTWCGDSRLYHIRNGEILYQTKDHSLLNELIDKKELTEEESKNYKKKNVIKRSIKGSYNPVKIDIKRISISELEPNDFFMLCSDGVLENLDDNNIYNLFKKDNSTDFISERIQNLCANNPRDNYTAVILKVQPEKINFIKLLNDYKILFFSSLISIIILILFILWYFDLFSTKNDAGNSQILKTDSLIKNEKKLDSVIVDKNNKIRDTTKSTKVKEKRNTKSNIKNDNSSQGDTTYFNHTD